MSKVDGNDLKYFKEACDKTYATIKSVDGKQDKVLKFSDKAASSWVSDTTFPDYPYRCDIACAGVTDAMYPDVVFGVGDATNGDYAPLSRTGNGIVSIWSKKNVTTTVLTIIVTI